MGGHTTCVAEMMFESFQNSLLGRTKRRWQDNIKIYIGRNMVSMKMKRRHQKKVNRAEFAKAVRGP